MNFEEKLNRFIESGAEKESRELMAQAYRRGAYQMGDIVLKLYNVVKLFKDKELRAWEIEFIAMEALAEVEHMIGGEK